MGRMYKTAKPKGSQLDRSKWPMIHTISKMMIMKNQVRQILSLFLR